LYQNRLNDYRRVDVGFSFIDNTTKKENNTGWFKTLRVGNGLEILIF
jgi:hypothetical protein